MSNGIQHGELVLFDCPRVRKSEYWQFIKLVAPHGRTKPPHGQTHWLSQDATDAYCLKCSKMFHFVKGSSNSVRRHMERFHRKELAKYHAISKASEYSSTFNAKGTQLAKANRKRANCDSDIARSLPTKRLQSLAGIDSPTTKPNVVDLLIRWLSTSMRPLGVVEDQGLIDMIESLSNTSYASSVSFLMPSPESMRHHLEVTAENVRFELKNRIRNEAASLSLSAEVWCNRTLSSDFIELSCSYLTENFVFKSFTLEVWDLEKPLGNDQEVFDQVQQTLRDYGLARTPTTLFVYNEQLERLPNLFEGSEMRFVSDFPHSIQCIVAPFLGLEGCSPSASSQSVDRVELLASFDTVSKCMQVIREAMSCCAVSRDCQDKIAVLQRVHGEIGKRFVDYSLPEDWVTLHDSLHRALRYQFVFDSLTLSSESPTVSTWYVVEAVLVLLHPLVEVMEVVNSGNTCTFPLVLPCLRIAMRELSRGGLFDELTVRYRTTLDYESPATQNHQLDVIRQHVFNEVTTRYGALCEQLLWCSALDPRCARLPHLEKEDERESCKQEIIHQALTLHLNQTDPGFTTATSSMVAATTPAGAVPVAPDDTIGGLDAHFDREMLFNGVAARASCSSVQGGLMHRLLYDEDDDAVTADEFNRESDMGQTLSSISNEVSTYFSEHQGRKTRIACPFQWWAANCERFPHLSPLARCWLGCVSCSSSSSTRRRLLSSEVVDEVRNDPLEMRKAVMTRIFLGHNLQ